MSKKQSKTYIPAIIHEQNITETLESNYMPYAMSVIVSRAIPEIDGFKPSHRKLLYTMFKMGLLTGDKTKSSNVIGQTMKLNPHGDGAIYETLVRLTEGNEALLIPLIESKGNFGKQYSRDMAYAAARYTEVKLAKICQEVFKDIYKNTVEFVDNYDDTEKEPLLLPTTFPNILVNPNQGIAVGMASSFCSFNLKEICNATIKLIENPEVLLEKYILAPDFKTGGEIVYNEKTMNQIYKTGKGSFKVRGKYVYDEENSCIEIFEIPYSTTIENIIDKIIYLVKQNKIKDITDVRDETDLKGLKITIDIKKNTKVQPLMHKLFSQTPLSDSFSCNFNLLIKGMPKTLGIKGILNEWLDFRTTSIKNQTAFDIAKKQEKLHLLTGLAKILVDIDKVISIIRNTKEEALVIPNLIEGFKIDEIQAEYIAEIKLRNINEQYILNRLKEIEDLKAEIDRLKDILSDDTKVKNIIKTELKEISSKYGVPRYSTILKEEHIEEIHEDDLIEDYGCKLYLTQQNYFKKITLASMRQAWEQKLKEDDFIIYEIETVNKSELLFFSDKFNVYKMKCSEISECKASNLGEYLNNLLNMEDDEKIIYIAPTTDYSGYMVFGFENGKIAKINFKSYETKVNRKKLVKAYSDKSKLLFAKFIDEDIDLVLFRSDKKATLINTSLLLPIATKNSQGVQVFTLKKNSLLDKICLASEVDNLNDDLYRSQKIPTVGHFLNDLN